MLFKFETKIKGAMKFTVPALSWGAQQKGVMELLLPFLTPC